MIIFKPSDDDSKDLDRSIELLNEYEIETCSQDFKQRIIDEAAAHPRIRHKNNPLSNISNGLVYVVFSRDARPMMMAFVMFIALLFAHGYEAQQSISLQNDVSDYASIMVENNSNIHLADYQSTSFEQDFSDTVTEMLINDFDDHFDI